MHLGEIVGDPATALDEQLTQEINMAATRLVAEAAKGYGARRFIYASSCSVYGAGSEILSEQSALKPVSLYARTKIGAERALLALNGPDFHPVILRLSTVYGLSFRPRFDLVINILTAKAVRDGEITIFGGEPMAAIRPRGGRVPGYHSVPGSTAGQRHTCTCGDKCR